MPLDCNRVLTIRHVEIFLHDKHLSKGYAKEPISQRSESEYELTHVF